MQYEFLVLHPVSLFYISLVAQKRLRFYGTNQVTILVWKRPYLDISIARQ